MQNEKRHLRQSGWFDIALLLLLLSALLFVLGSLLQESDTKTSPAYDFTTTFEMQSEDKSDERPNYYLLAAIVSAASVFVFFCIGVVSPWIRRSPRRERRGKRIAACLRFALCLLLTAIIVFPVYWMILTSFLSSDELLSVEPVFFPSTFSFDNYGRMIRHAAFGQYFVNTAIVTGFVLLGEITIGTLAAYGFSKGRFKGKSGLYMLALCSIAIPAHALYTPLYVMASKLNWINTYRGLILPNLVSGLFIWIMRHAFLSVDECYLDAAKIDGMGRIRTISRVLIPLCGPAFKAACFVTLVKGWNSYVWPRLMTTNDKKRTIALGIQYLRRTASGMETVNYNEIMAGAILAILPIMALFVILHRCLASHLRTPPIK